MPTTRTRPISKQTLFAIYIFNKRTNCPAALVAAAPAVATTFRCAFVLQALANTQRSVEVGFDVASEEYPFVFFLIEQQNQTYYIYLYIYIHVYINT